MENHMADRQATPENATLWQKFKGLAIGNYDWHSLCMPQWPYCRKEPVAPPPFFGPEDKLSFLVATIMGLQHALAMAGGIVTPPIIVGSLANNTSTTQHLISSSLIVSGICTVIHCFGVKIPGTRGRYQYGTGIVSVIGTSFTYINVTVQSILNMMASGLSFDDAYGKIVGTVLVCCWLAVAISFMPPRWLKRAFPNLVCGVTIFLIGAGLIGTGMQSWGGGATCAANHANNPPTLCVDGNVKLPYGSPEYIGLGALVFLVLVVIELFGSPFLRNCEVIIALLFGYFISAVITTDGDRYVTKASYDIAPVITFVWVKNFNFGIYAPAVLPFLIGFIITTVEAIGDITATEEASMLNTAGAKHAMRIQGGLLGDGINSFFAALCGTLPNTTFAQNNGVLSLTRCTSRYAGYACGTWLFLFGVLGKFGAFWTSVPSCVLGGMTTFLFAGVAVSGIKVMCLDPITRRNRFILCVSLGLGLGVTLVPYWATNNLWNVAPYRSAGLRGFRDAIILILSNGFTLGCLSSIALHLLLPLETDDMAAISANVLPSTKDGQGSLHKESAIRAYLRKHNLDETLRTMNTELDGGLHGVKSLELSSSGMSDAPKAPDMSRAQTGKHEDSAHGPASSLT